MRGEHSLYASTADFHRGSSPHARGARALRGARRLGVGIIPACAGSTAIRELGEGLRGDHPRVRGEHVTCISKATYTAGSSPRARGAHRETILRKLPNGIIPACAGSTGGIRLDQLFSGDHPRVRGEHCNPLHASKARGGSSPRARGALALMAWFEVPSGIIPACAGSTLFAMAAKRVYRDHPRVRGEHPEKEVTQQDMMGSSPRARGALGAINVITPTHGIIPACAGSTQGHKDKA